MRTIERTISIEELLEEHPSATRLLLRHNVACLVCGEPAWGTLEEVLRGGGKSEAEIDAVVGELKAELENEDR